MSNSGYVVISRDVLPDVFHKVMEVKKLVACGEYKSSAAACKAVGISRSAFYKYRDSVFAYEEKMTQKIISVYISLIDEPGILSAVLGDLYKSGANVLTLNQSIPVDGVATITMTMKLSENNTENILPVIEKTEGVISVRLLSGE